MKIGLISDVHANIHALEAVLSALEQAGVQEILCAGDLVCYGAFPSECIAVIQEHNIQSVAGNYDFAVAHSLVSASQKSSTEKNESIKRSALSWTQDILKQKEKSYLEGLPWRKDLIFDNRKICIVHASFRELDEMVLPGSSKLDDLIDLAKADVLVLGHSHVPFVLERNNTLVVNPGAVGRSLDGDVRASFAVMDTENLKAEIFQVSYDIGSASDAIINTSMPREIAEMVRGGLRRVEQLEGRNEPA